MGMKPFLSIEGEYFVGYPEKKLIAFNSLNAFSHPKFHVLPVTGKIRDEG
jgi:hypothetical protein